jgi:HEAT repeat protein
MSGLEALLQHCTVKLSLPNQSGWGTGFFVAPGLILTCAHVVKGGEAIQVRWQNHDLTATVDKVCPDPYDIALLRVMLVAEVNPPCVVLDDEIRSRDPLYLFGYPDEGDRQGEPRTFFCDGVTGGEVAAILFNLGQVRPGMSGSPLLNQRMEKVCGMVKFTRDRSSNLGGGAVQARVILEQLPELRELQQAFHRGDRRWGDLMPGGQAEIDVQPYLRVIANTYERWWQLYTLTDAEGKQRPAKQVAPTFDFGLMVQMVKPKKQFEAKTEEPQEKVERFTVLEGIRQYAAQHVLLVGRPGFGKSTALARLMLEEAALSPNSGRGEPKRIPVLVELRYWQGSIAQLILDALARHELSVTPEQLEIVLLRSLLLFDGVNELPSEEARSQLSAFRRNHPKVPMIFTTRELSLGGDLGIEKKLEMQPLTEGQMQVFVRTYVPEQAEQMLRQLKERLREFGQTPLLLWMLCALFQQTGRIPENLGLVFQEFTQGYARQLKEDVQIESDRAWWQPVLKQLAWVMMQGTQPMDLRVAIQEEEAVKVIAQFLQNKVPYAEDFARKCLGDLQKHHLIQVGTNPKELEFRHQLIQEYYAAEALLEKLPRLTDEQLKQTYLNFLKWTEPLALMLALVEDKTQAKRVVRLAINMDLMLAARLAGEVKPKFQGHTIGLIAALEMPDWLEVELLGETRSENAISGLLQYLEDSASIVSRSAAEALGKIGSETAIPGLLQLLEDSKPGVHGEAAEALGKIGSETAIPGLLQLLEHSQPEVRREAAKALGKIGSETAIPGLLQLLEDSKPEVREIIAYALGEIGSEAAIPGLLQLLEDSKPEVREIIAYALGEIESEVAIPGLLQLLEGSDEGASRKATEVLGKIGSEAAIPGLLQRLEHFDPCVRERAAKALGEIGSEVAIPGLLQLLEDSGDSGRWSAEDALGKIGFEAVISKLLQRLELSGSNVCARAAKVLGEIGSEVAIPRLLQLLEDSNSYVCLSAENALVKIASEAAIPGLLQRLEHPDPYVGESAAKVLGEIGSEVAITGLLQRLEHSDPSVRERVAYALGEIGSEAAISGLLQRLEDSNPYVCWSAEYALGKIGSEAAIPGLLQLLEDSNDRSGKVEEALGNIAKKHANTLSPHLPHLLTLIPTESGQKAHRVIRAIQENCKYYNYEIYQSYLEAQKRDQLEGQTNNSHPNAQIYNIGNIGNLNTGNVIIHGDQIGAQTP